MFSLTSRFGVKSSGSPWRGALALQHGELGTQPLHAIALLEKAQLFLHDILRAQCFLHPQADYGIATANQVNPTARA